MSPGILTSKIIAIINPCNFYYHACNNCSKKLLYNEISERFRCERCTTDPVPRCSYKLTFRILYRTHITVTVFDKAIQSFFGCPAFELIKLLNYVKEYFFGDDRAVERLIDDLLNRTFVGRVFMFHLKPCTQNESKSEPQNFTAKQMYCINEVTDNMTVLEHLLFELQFVSHASPNQDLLQKAKDEAAVTKRIVRDIQKKLIPEVLSGTSYFGDSWSYKSLSEAPLAGPDRLPTGASVLLDDTFVNNFFDGSFSFAYDRRPIDPVEATLVPDESRICETPGPLGPSDQEVVADEVMLDVGKSDLEEGVSSRDYFDCNFQDPLLSTENMEAVLSTPDLCRTPRLRKRSNLFLTSTPLCSRSHGKRSRPSDVHQLSFVSKDRSVSDIFVDESSAIQDESPSGDIFDSIG